MYLSPFFSFDFLSTDYLDGGGRLLQQLGHELRDGARLNDSIKQFRYH